jgi:hypothetical protein
MNGSGRIFEQSSHMFQKNARRASGFSPIELP